MKRMLLSLALAGMAMAGCVKNEVEVLSNEEKGLRIGFDSPVLYDNVSSKANVTGELSGAIYPQGENFIIYAAQHTGEFTGWPLEVVDEPNSQEDGLCQFSGSVISYNPSFDAWVPTYNNSGSIGYYYWPENKKLSFSAMSPANLGSVNSSATTSYGASGLTVTGYVNPEVGQQFDLLFAKRTMNHIAADMLQSAEAYSGIPIEFQHALSSIHFSIDKELPEQEVYLKKIELTNVKNKGNFAENIDESVSLDYTIGSIDSSVKPAWTVDDNSKVNYVPFDAKQYERIEFPVNPRHVADVVNDIPEANRLDMVSHSLLVIPQTIGADTQLVITYEIEGVGKVKNYNLAGLRTLGSNEQGVTGGETGQINSWEIGHRYIYRIYYSTSSEKKDIIYFSPSVEGWELVQVVQINL